MDDVAEAMLRAEVSRGLGGKSRSISHPITVEYAVRTRPECTSYSGNLFNLFFALALRRVPWRCKLEPGVPGATGMEYLPYLGLNPPAHRRASTFLLEAAQSEAGPKAPSSLGPAD
jgi:hypothetical protein